MTETSQHPELLACAFNVRSMHNVGAIYRTADGAGFSAVACAGYTGTPPDPRIAKVALGAESALDTITLESDEAFREFLADTYVVLLEQHRVSVPPSELSKQLPPGPGSRIALVACEELFGAPDWLIERADTILEIPMHGSKESLNVSVAFGIAAYAVRSWIVDDGTDNLRSRSRGAVREGVLTKGVTVGQVPDRRPASQKS